MKAGKLALAGVLASGVLMTCNLGSEKSIDQMVQPDQKIEQFRENPHKVLTEDAYLYSGHQMIVLSNMAEGFTGYCIKNSNCNEYEAELMNIVDLALGSQISPYEQGVENQEDLGNQGLYLSHLNVIIGSYKRATGKDTYKPINQIVSEYLAKRTIEDEHKHVPSYEVEEGEKPFKWPADQTVTLYSLHLFDKNYGTSLRVKPIKEWLKFMHEKGTDKKTKLHVSEVSVNDFLSKQPRGCALSWSVRYMSQFAPNDAKRLWHNYKTHFKKDFKLAAAFREWKEGSEFEGRSDIDSGPVIWGMGVSATAFAIGSSKMIGDTVTFNQLKNAEKIGDILIAWDKNIETIANSILAKAIQFNVDNMIKWY